MTGTSGIQHVTYFSFIMITDTAVKFHAADEVFSYAIKLSAFICK